MKNVTLIVSDMHIGGGKADPGDDFVDSHGQFTKFISEQTASPEGRAGGIELIINGDCFEFAQVNQAAYTIRSAKYWCSETESLRKLEVILTGHADIFKALQRFREAGNALTFMAGNHDVELYWPRVQERLRAVMGDVSFELKMAWYARYDGRLQISHGHLLDPANSFQHWDNPILQPSKGDPRLEMCPGTLFMVNFVNALEAKYPFADNLHPVTKLASILWKEDKFGLVSVAWILAKFGGAHPITSLGKETVQDLIGPFQDRLKYVESFRNAVTELYRECYEDPEATPQQVKAKLSESEQAVEDFLMALFATVDSGKWVKILNEVGGGTLSAEGGEGQTLSIGKAGVQDSYAACRDAAQDQFCKGAQVVVIGHTHLPDSMEIQGRHYYNPGSWTRYVGGKELEGMTLEDLKVEENFPYELNYVRITKTEEGLRSEMTCFERQAGGRAGQ